MNDYKDYLGDGLYVRHDGYQVWLYASDGLRTTNEVALEPEVLLAFDRWRERVRDDLHRLARFDVLAQLKATEESIAAEEAKEKA